MGYDSQEENFDKKWWKTSIEDFCNDEDTYNTLPELLIKPKDPKWEAILQWYL